MMTIILYKSFEIVVGLSSGIVIGSAFLALLTFLGVIPRLMQWVKNTYNGKAFTASLLIGTLYGTYLTFTGSSIMFGFPFLVVWGLLQGIFNGMLVAALVEVLHVFPMISKRLGLRDKIRYLMMAVVFGKIAGSLFQWLYLAK
ncbi:MAG TPA: stage V sporulation protein AB [Pseudogracilibacillus sp.]|nr:stage V sporulation protein AB [Pseudogracilibacillus sp.]